MKQKSVARDGFAEFERRCKQLREYMALVDAKGKGEYASDAFVNLISVCNFLALFLILSFSYSASFIVDLFFLSFTRRLCCGMTPRSVSHPLRHCTISSCLWTGHLMHIAS